MTFQFHRERFLQTRHFGREYLDGRFAKKWFAYSKNKGSAQKVENITSDNPEVAFPPKKKGRRERSTKLGKMETKSVKKSLDGSDPQERNITSAENPSETVNIVRKMTEKVKKAPKDTPQSREEESGPMVRSSFEDCLSGKFLSGYIELSMAVEEGSHSWVQNCCQAACFCDVGTDKEHCSLALFLRSFSIEVCKAQICVSHSSQGYLYER